MRYSVWNHGAKRYEYYEDTRTEGTHAGAPSGLASGKIGLVPEAGAWRLPLGAKKVGSGELPVGRIASRGGAALAAADLANPTHVVVAVGAAYLAYLAWRKLR